MKNKCSKCNKTSITYIRYNGTHLCDEHFIQYFKKRIKKEIKKQGKTKNNSTIGVALSGGKDSITSLYITNNIFSNRKNIDIHAISVDEGIKGYRDISLSFAKKNCNILDIEHHIVKFKDYIGKTMDEIALSKNDIGKCSYCGVFRRFCLNKKSKELGINRLVTGHNLDDMSQSILMNFVNGDLKKLARLGPHQIIQPGLVPRMMPLRNIPEKEIALYAIINNYSFHDDICPYSNQAFRGIFRDIIDELEYKNPGTRHSILNSYNNMKDILLNEYPQVKLKKCKICNEPTSHINCKTCILKNKL
jgi:uncharacterized protein (TIGR00269 family)